MTIRQLVPGELSVLRALRDFKHPTRWATSVDLADRTGLPSWAVRSILKELRRAHLVQRGTDPGHCGQYTITETGIAHLCSAAQLRLAR